MGLRAQQQKQKSEENSSNSADAGTSDVGNRGVYVLSWRNLTLY
jgi:hypothetical protein